MLNKFSAKAAHDIRLTSTIGWIDLVNPFPTQFIQLNNPLRLQIRTNNVAEAKGIIVADEILPRLALAQWHL